MTIAEAVVLGSTMPRLWSRPLAQGPVGPCGCGCSLTPSTSHGFDVDDFARDILGMPLDPWQRWLCIHAGELLPSGLPRFRRALVLVSRQSGKTFLLVVLTLYWLYVDRVGLVLGTSTNLDTARESWEKAVSMAQDVPALAREIAPNGIRRANGEQTLTTVWRGRYKIAASNRQGGRGFTIDRLVMDEFREHADWTAYNAAVPAMNAVRDAQCFMITNQGDDRSEPLNALRDQALEGLDERLGLFEWSSPDGMAATDVEALAMANPSLGRRVFLDALIGDALLAQAAGGEQLAKFLTEVHCRRVSLLNPAIDVEAWGECAVPRDDLGRELLEKNGALRVDAEGREMRGLDGLRDKVAMCLDVSLDELHATLYAAAVDGERVRVDAVRAWEGQMAVRDMCADLPGLIASAKPRVVGWFPGGPAASAAASLKERADWPPSGVTIEAIRNDVSAVCMGFAEQVRSLQVAHSDDPLLNAHVAAAEKLYHGDGWRFVRKGAGHVDAAYAAAGAVHLARTLEAPAEPQIW